MQVASVKEKNYLDIFTINDLLWYSFMRVTNNNDVIR